MISDLNYKVVGEGHPVIILHGLFGMLDNWKTFANKLSNEGFMVFLLDQRDHGKSPHTDTFDYPTLAEDLYAFMQENFIFNAHLLGHSMGGKTAIQFANQYPDMIDKLVVVDIGIKRYQGGHERILEALQSVPIEEIRSRSEVKSLLDQYGFSDGISLFLMKNLSRNKDGSYRWKMNLPLLVKYYQNILSEVDIETLIETDTLFVRGDKSEYISDQDYVKISSVFESSDLVTVENAGHWVHAEQPEALLKIVNHFLNEY